MVAKAIAKPTYNSGEAVYNPAERNHKANMAKKENHSEMDP